MWDDLKVDGEIIIEGKTTRSIIQNVESMQIDGEDVTEVQKGHHIGIKVKGKVSPNDVVYKRILRK